MVYLYFVSFGGKDSIDNFAAVSGQLFSFLAVREVVRETGIEP